MSTTLPWAILCIRLNPVHRFVLYRGTGDARNAMQSRARIFQPAADMRTAVEQLVDHYRDVFRDRVRDLPITNAKLDVEAVGFRQLDEHLCGVLITPWFMNLVLLPRTDRWRSSEQGSTCTFALPGGKLDFTVAHDDKLGTILSAALFSSVSDFPDQAMARDVANETLRLLFTPDTEEATGRGRTMSRRQLLRQLGIIVGNH